MRLKSIRIGGALLAATALLFAGAQQASAQVMMTGDWTLEVSTDNGVTMPELTLEQDGMKLTGHYVSEALGANEVTGTVDGNKVTVSFMASLEGVGEASVLYIGTVDDEGVWSGTIDILDGQLTGTFTAKKN
ncbi:MAG: hypothetical protein MK486_11140 [Gemmatimonadetes bacterium]|jgi:hypothetical protein|nr:hypothetical protein [Gemmatimonadota bacterium]|tara:strand:+ start:6814 stop:7209 length:396 start_codon:yes stop_codon:yes gene_type:complete